MTGKNTRRALLMSALAILACAAMLIGTTFAWFTDTASTAVNTITSGRLDVALEVENPNYNEADSGAEQWISAEGKTLDFVKSPDAPADEQLLWEPGCTYALPTLRIVNKGNLALKYKVIITGIAGDAKLNKAIDWTIKVDGNAYNADAEQHLGVGAAQEFTLAGTMRTDAGNEYQNLTITGVSLTVVAAQDTVEFDSKDNQYDKDAAYPVAAADASAFNDGTVFINTYLQRNAHVILTNDITLSSSITLQGADLHLLLDLNGHKLTVPQILLNNAAEVVISDSVGTGEINFTSQNGIQTKYEGARVVLNGGTLKASSNYKIYSFTVEKEGSVVMLASKDSSFVMNGGKVVADNNRSDVPAGSMAVRLYASDSSFIMNGGEIVKTVGTLAAIQASGDGNTKNTKIEINDGSVKSNSVAIYHPQNGSLAVNGGYIEGQTAIYAKSGTLAFAGGTIHAAAKEKTEYTYTSGSMIATGDAVVIDACGYPGGNPVVSVTGGTYTVTAEGAHGIAYYKYNGNTASITNTAGVDIFEN